MSNNNRIFGLDLLRAFAILFVLFEHGFNLVDPEIMHGIFRVPIFDGVTMFFVLSGFLIGRILLRTFSRENVTVKTLLEFWTRRWFRTLPNYFLVLTLLIIISHPSISSQQNYLIKYYFFSQNIASPHPFFFGEAWSLSIEEWFYLIIPILMYLTTKLKNVDWRKIMPFWIVLIIVLVTAFRIYRAYNSNYQTFIEWDFDLRKQVVTRFDTLMFGVLAAYINIYKLDLWRKAGNKVFVIGITLLVLDQVFYQHRFYTSYLTLSISAIGTFLLLPRLSTLNCNTRWIVSIFTFISLSSYSMYLLSYTLVQLTILPMVMRSMSDSFLLFKQHQYLIQYIMYWIITLTTSFFLYQYYERPMTALREKFHAREQKSVTAFPDPKGDSKFNFEV